jgi:hypothetical protein
VQNYDQGWKELAKKVQKHLLELEMKRKSSNIRPNNVMPVF